MTFYDFHVLDMSLSMPTVFCATQVAKNEEYLKQITQNNKSMQD